MNTMGDLWGESPDGAVVQVRLIKEEGYPVVVNITVYESDQADAATVCDDDYEVSKTGLKKL